IWGAGLPVATATGDQRHPVATADGEGGAIVAWEDDRSGNADVYAARITYNGAIGWAGGYGGGAGDQTGPSLSSDGEGGAFIAWQDTRNGGSDIYAIRVAFSGGIPPGWSGARPVCIASGTQQHPSCASDGAGGVIVAWEDDRSDATSGFDLYALRIRGDATLASGWTTDGNAMCAASGDQTGIHLVSDGIGGAIASWEDDRSGNPDIYALQITASGAPDSGWTANGTVLCGAGGAQVAPAIGSDGTGGAFVTWTDQRSGEADVYATHVRGLPLGSPVGTPVAALPRALQLFAPHPNPAFGRTEFAFELPAVERVDLDVLDTAGRRIQGLVSDAHLPAGSHRSAWEGTDGRGRRVGPGVYYVRLRAAGRTQVRRFVMLR
ncbi:MAG TPA: hypothetical protein VLV15_01600, partial [Dongiaceae bacterium]|nr:hypothetical protein [Dongiaceae bacterium]